MFDFLTEPPLHELVGRIHFPFEVSGDQDQADKNASYHVAQNQLKEGQVAAKGDSRCPDNRESAGFRGDDGQ